MQLKVKTEAIKKIMLELLIKNRIIIAIRIFLIKKVLLQPNFETRSRLNINLYIMLRRNSYATSLMKIYNLPYLM